MNLSGLDIRYIVAILFTVLALFASYIYFASPPSLSGFATENASILYTNGTRINGSIYLASTLSQQEQGYMYQKNIGNCNGSKNLCIGMLFVFSPGAYVCMWMKNTEIPLKQAWIGSNMLVSAVYSGVPYSTYAVCNTSSYVLETQLPINASDRIIT